MIPHFVMFGPDSPAAFYASMVARAFDLSLGVLVFHGFVYPSHIYFFSRLLVCAKLSAFAVETFF